MGRGRKRRDLGSDKSVDKEGVKGGRRDGCRAGRVERERWDRR